ncbi:MAG: hypothetical protein JO199_10525 [Candidatus Eremiobacteraeota bacterium]|nr:hypothetical protein [Candidatus Eremiobacteraeota bacterium]
MRIVVRVPRRKHLRPHYISAATQGMVFAFTGSATLTTAVGLTPTSHGCTGYPSATMCTIDVAIPPGTYTLTTTAYNTAPVSGTIPNNASVLSTASMPATVTAGKNNTISLTLDGVPATMTISDVPSATSGTPFGSPQSFTVTVKDASGETIVGTYANAVSLLDGDPTGATSIVTSGSDNPPAGKLLGSTDAAALTYNGAAIVAGISASASNATSNTVGFVPSGVANGVYLKTDPAPGTDPGLCPGGAPGELRAAMCAASSGATIFFGCGNPCTIVLSAPLPPIAQNLTVDGGAFGNVAIDGASKYRVFYARSGTIAIKNLQIQNALAYGGAAGSPIKAGGGGGGAGLGGGIFIDSATVALTNDYFLNNAAHGGAGGTGTSYTNGLSCGSGGGGMGANGALGGGGIVAAASGGNGGMAFDGTTADGGADAQPYGAGAMGPSLNPADYGGGAGIGGSATQNDATPGGGVTGGNGGFGGGGGGGGASVDSGAGHGGAGGFGGGGGGGGNAGIVYASTTAGGAGGKGGGGGAGGGAGGSLATISGGNADASNGGGGAAAGPAIFINTGTLTTTGSGASGSSVTAGSSGGGTATAGGTDATPVYNQAGTVNGSTTAGGISSALGSTPPANRGPRSRPRTHHRR